jgi:hypothetical protein
MMFLHLKCICLHFARSDAVLYSNDKNCFEVRFHLKGNGGGQSAKLEAQKLAQGGAGNQFLRCYNNFVCKPFYVYFVTSMNLNHFYDNISKNNFVTFVLASTKNINSLLR